MTDKFCINCAHSIQSTAEDIYFCRASPKGEPDLVTGKTEYKYCSVVRMYSGECGREGKLFELPPERVNIEDIFPKFPSIRG